MAPEIKEEKKKEWAVSASVTAMRTSNPIRRIVDQLKVVPNPDKPMISLSIGDPTVYGNLPLHDALVDAVVKSVKSGKSNGYPHSCGYPSARKAIANRYTTPEAPLTEEDVVITSGCSHAIDICIGVLANEGDNILIPCPGFSLYETCCNSKGIKCRYYNLLPEQGWEADINHMRSLVDDRTRAILINNPSNPCGSVYSKKHLQDLIAFAEEYKIPIIADEIYADIVFEGSTFHPMATLTSTVPILAVGGIAKRYLVPGWRVGWILIHDRNGIFKQVREGILRLTTLILGSNSVTQAALEDIFNNVPQSFYDNLNKTLERNARYSEERISKIPGLSIIRPQGAMYLMVGIDVNSFDDSITDDVEFSKALLAEECVMVLPGSCFNLKNYFRIVTCPPIHKLEEAYTRLEAFCQRHHI